MSGCVGTKAYKIVIRFNSKLLVRYCSMHNRTYCNVLKPIKDGSLHKLISSIILSGPIGKPIRFLDGLPSMYVIERVKKMRNLYFMTRTQNKQL